MKTIYAEDILLLNTCINYLLLLETARLCSIPYRRCRYALAGGLGAAWCLAGLLPSLSFLGSPPMMPVLFSLMVVIAFGKERRIAPCAAGFLGISVLFGGCVYAACILRGRCFPRGQLIRADMGMLLLSFALCRVFIVPLFHRRADPERPAQCQITIARNARTVCLTALRDTGNRLYDPITGCAAVLAEADALAPLFTKEELPHLRAESADTILSVPGMRLISGRGFDGQTHLLAAFRPEKISVDGTPRDDLLVAVSPVSLGKSSTYSAIV